MKICSLLILLFASAVVVPSQASEAAPETGTLKLIRAYDAAWDRGDVAAMYEMLDPDCVFKSPFQTRLGRDAIREHVFKNTAKFRDTVNVEESSKTDGDIAYSFVVSTFNEYSAGGTLKSKRRANHLYILTRRPGQDWKFRFFITTEESHATP